jgi:hypothetical protein
MLKGERKKKNDWQLEIKYRERNVFDAVVDYFSARKDKSIELLFSCEVRHVVNLGLG